MMMCLVFAALSVASLDMSSSAHVRKACPYMYEYMVAMFFIRVAGLGVWACAVITGEGHHGNLLLWMFMTFGMSDTACTWQMMRSKECMDATSKGGDMPLLVMHGLMEMGWDSLIVLMATRLIEEDAYCQYYRLYYSTSNAVVPSAESHTSAPPGP